MPALTRRYDCSAPHCETRYKQVGIRASAARALLEVSESGGPTTFAHSGIMRALNHGKQNPEREPRPISWRSGPKRDRGRRHRPICL